MKKIIFVAAVLIFAGAAAAVLLPDRQFEVKLTEDQLLEAISKKLPFEKSYFVIFDVTLDNPRISLPEGSDRVHAGLDVAVDISIGDKRFVGSTDASAGIRYEPEAGQFFLVEPNVEALTLQGIPIAYSEKVDDALGKALDAFFGKRPVYTFKDSDSRQKAAKFTLKKVTVADGVLVLTLGL